MTAADQEKELLGIVTELARQADGYDADEVSKLRTEALDYYFMRARGDEIPGRSQAVDGSLSAVVEANLAQMMESLTSDNLVDFASNGEADERQAELESDYVTHVIMRENPGWLLLCEAIKDALLQRNGVIKALDEERTDVSVTVYEGVTPEAQAELALEHEVLDFDAEAGTLKVRERKTRKRIRLAGAPIENCLYTKNWHSLGLHDIPFWGERHVDIRSTLVERFENAKDAIEELPAYVAHNESESARNPASGSGDNNNTTSDPSLDEIEWIEAYVLLDRDGDGIAERHRVAFVENQAVLEIVDVDTVDYAAGAVLLNSHRFLGVSMHDKLKQLVDERTGLKRLSLDNAAVATKSRTVYLDRKVDTKDLEDGAPNNNIAVRGVDDWRKAVGALVQPDITGGVNMLLDSTGRQRAELAGAALDMSQAQMQLSDRAGSQGIDRAYSVMEQLASMMMRTIAESLLKNLYLLVHAKLRKSYTEPIDFKRQADWITVTPSEWPERTTATVRLGMSPGQRQRRAAALGNVLELQAGFADKGYNNILVDLNKHYAALLDWCRAKELDNPEQYWIDPRSEAAQQAVQAAQQKAEADKAAQQKLTDMALGLEQLRVGLQKYEGDAARALEWRVAQLQAAVQEMKVVGKATADLELQQNEKANEEQRTQNATELLAEIEGIAQELSALESDDETD